MSDAQKKPPLQFGLSGLMLIVLFVAVACSGWKLWAWMENTRAGDGVISGIVVVLLTGTAMVAWTSMVIGGLRARILSFIGFLVNAAAMIWIYDFPPVGERHVILLFAMIAPCLPLAAVSGTIANVCHEPNRTNIALAVFSCFSAGWILSFIYMNAQR